MKQKAKFFCENCGAEVPANAKFCTHCGKFFSSVRCPNCGATGMPSQFKNGCPNCGYAVGNTSVNTSEKKATQNARLSRKSKKNISTAFNSYSERNGTSSTKRKLDESLPLWMYGITAFALLFIIWCVYNYVFN